MTDIETSLRRSYATLDECVPDASKMLLRARREGRALRRRRRAAVTIALAASILGAVVGAKALDGPATHRGAPPPVATLPVPAGEQLTVYRYSTANGPTQIVSFIDSRGRWCLGAQQSGATAGASADYQCVAGQLLPGKSGFGRVATRTDAFGYDGIHQWLQGVATSDVDSVKVVLADGSSRTAHLVRDTSGVVFSVRIAWLATPVFYQAYDVRGQLVEQLRVPQSLPHDPFVDWRPFADTSAGSGS